MFSQGNIANEFVPASPERSKISSYLDGLRDGRQEAGQLLLCGSVASRICSKQHAEFLCCSHLAFSPAFLLGSNHTVVLTQSWLGRISVLFNWIDQISI